jgi:hypothetical protein
MTDYTISNQAQWNSVSAESLVSGDTVKLTSSFTFTSPVLPSQRITLVDGVTFDGQGYVVTLASGNHTGLLELPTTSAPDCNVQNVGVDGTNSTLLTGCGFLISGSGSSTSPISGRIYNCYSTGSITNIYCSGIVGNITNNCDLIINRCRFDGDIGADYSGGIVGAFWSVESGSLELNECYTITSFSSGNQRGGLSGAIINTNNSSTTVDINNCYNITTSSDTNSRGGIIHANPTNNYPTITINNCYSSGVHLAGASSAPDAGTLFIYNSVGDGAITNANPADLGANINNSTNLEDIEGTLANAVSAGWQDNSDTWTAGTGTNYPTLDQFTLGPWTSYSTYNDEALLTQNYTGGNARGSSGGGGGDPHIFPLFGKTYDLPHSEETFLLLDNQRENNNDHLIIKGKCWYVPRDIYEKDVETHIEDGVSKLEYMDFYRRQKLTFFKYLKIEYNNEEYIFDMDSLEIKKYTNKADFENGQLPTKKRYKKSKSISISRPMKRYQLLFSKHVTRKSQFKYSQNAMAREVTIKTKDNKINLLLISDPQKVDLRNSIELTVASNAKSFYGSLIRKEVKTVEF